MAGSGPLAGRSFSCGARMSEARIWRIRDRLEELLGLPVVVDNDANCAALAELTTGAAMGTRNAVVMTLGTGIGAGIIADGAVYRGGSFAGEAGHMTMIPDGDPCECGRRGCWETLVSGRRFGAGARRIMKADPSGILATIVGDAEPSGSYLGIAAAAGDVAARDAVVEAGRWLGRGVANLVAILDPEVVVVGGAAVAVGDVLLAAAREEARPVRGGCRPSAAAPNRSGPMRSPGGCHRGSPSRRAKVRWPGRNLDASRSHWLRRGPNASPQIPAEPILCSKRG